jgi:hypothetical protein
MLQIRAPVAQSGCCKTISRAAGSITTLSPAHWSSIQKAGMTRPCLEARKTRRTKTAVKISYRRSLDVYVAYTKHYGEEGARVMVLPLSPSH